MRVVCIHFGVKVGEVGKFCKLVHGWVMLVILRYETLCWVTTMCYSNVSQVHSDDWTQNEVKISINFSQIISTLQNQ